MIPELIATRERVAWIFHEKARRLHSEANNGKAGLHVVLGRGILRERDRKEGGPALCGAASGLREGEIASEKIDNPERRCRQWHGKARPPIPRSFLWGVIFRGGSCQKSGSRGCAQGRAVQATRITLGPNRVFGRYIDVALAWGVICRSNSIAHPDTIEHLFTVPP